MSFVCMRPRLVLYWAVAACLTSVVVVTVVLLHVLLLPHQRKSLVLFCHTKRSQLEMWQCIEAKQTSKIVEPGVAATAGEEA